LLEDEGRFPLEAGMTEEEEEVLTDEEETAAFTEEDDSFLTEEEETALLLLDTSASSVSLPSFADVPLSPPQATRVMDNDIAKNNFLIRTPFVRTK
jgi:hypothetical protein